MGTFTLGPGSGWTSGELLSLSSYLSFYLSLYLSLYVSLFLSSPLWHHMLSLRESLRVFLAGAPSPCREVGSGTDKFNDDQQKYFAILHKQAICSDMKICKIIFSNIAKFGSGTDKFNDDQRFTTREHDLRAGGDFYGKDNTENLSQEIKMDNHYTLDVKYYLV